MISLLKFDSFMISAVTRFLRRWFEAGVPWPVILLAWRAAFCAGLAAFVAAFAFSGPPGPLFAAVAVAVAAAVAGMAGDVSRLLDDARLEWCDAMFRRYAAESAARRFGLVPVRLVALLLFALLSVMALLAPVVGSGDGGTLFAVSAAALYFAAVILAGGWAEAAEPPGPGMRLGRIAPAAGAA